MTANKAYRILAERDPLSKVRWCLDYGGFFVFCLAPIYIDDNKQYYCGTVMDAVDKKTGRVFQYDILSEPLAYERATEVKVDTIYNAKI